MTDAEPQSTRIDPPPRDQMRAASDYWSWPAWRMAYYAAAFRGMGAWPA